MLELTSRARGAVAGLIAGASRPFAGLRIGVRDVTCGGITYALALVEAAEDGDITVPCGEVTVFVAARGAPLLAGTRVDYVPDGGGGFRIENPNVRSCGACPGAGGRPA